MLQEKICFITGSTRGIGWATAKLFAANGATVVLNGRANRDLLDARVKELESSGASCWGVLADASDASAVAGCYREIFARHRRLDVLVNNAGIFQGALLGTIAAPMMRCMFDTNALGPLLHLQEAARMMARKNSGSIINVSSIVGRVGFEGQTLYAASKAAVIGMTLAAAKELAPKMIRVNAVAPGFIETEMTRALPEDKLRAAAGSIKMGRAGTPEDVAAPILFLASDLSRYVTGQVLGVDGGMLM